MVARFAFAERVRHNRPRSAGAGLMLFSMTLRDVDDDFSTVADFPTLDNA